MVCRDAIDVLTELRLTTSAHRISASFGLLRNTFGLIADSVRISGDTAAGALGSSVKLLGSAVKSVSTSFDSVDRLLSPPQDEGDTSEKARKPLTSERLKMGKGSDDRHLEGRTYFIRNSRSIAAQSFR
jgi:hypothetical protein